MRRRIFLRLLVQCLDMTGEGEIGECHGNPKLKTQPFFINPSRYANMDEDDSDDMEAGFEDMRKEEARR